MLLKTTVLFANKVSPLRISADLPLSSCCDPQRCNGAKEDSLAPTCSPAPPFPCSFRGSRHSTIRSRLSAKMPPVHQNKRKKMEGNPSKNHNRNSVSRLLGQPSQTSPICSTPQGPPAEPCCQGRALGPLTICHL